MTKALYKKIIFRSILPKIDKRKFVTWKFSVKFRLAIMCKSELVIIPNNIPHEISKKFIF